MKDSAAWNRKVSIRISAGCFPVAQTSVSRTVQQLTADSRVGLTTQTDSSLQTDCAFIGRVVL